jgi:hypothetical protein
MSEWAAIFAALLDANTTDQRQEVMLRRLNPFPFLSTLRLPSSGAQFQAVNHFVPTRKLFPQLGHGNFPFGASRIVSVKTMARMCTGRRVVRPYPRVAVAQRQAERNGYFVFVVECISVTSAHY